MTGSNRLCIDTAITAVKNHALSPEEAADEVVEECSKSVRGVSSTGDFTQLDDTPGLESFLWSFWSDVLQIAEEDADVHIPLAQILAILKTKGSEGCDGWRIWGSPISWGELPLFGPVSREEMNGPRTPRIESQGRLDIRAPRAQALLSGDPPSEDPIERGYTSARKQWLNINAFLAKLWALDIVNEQFYGITTMRMCLEPLTLSTTSGPTKATDGVGEPQELQIEVAAAWVTIAGVKMYTCREILGPRGNSEWQDSQGSPGGSGGTWDGVNGYHPDRWAHWRQILAEISQGTWRRNVLEAAQAAVEAMDTIERGAASA